MAQIKYCTTVIKYGKTLSHTSFLYPSPNTLYSAYDLVRVFHQWCSALVGCLGEQININAVVI